MIDLVNHNLDALAKLCDQFGVAKLELFGSACRGEFNPQTSDIDVIATFARTQQPGISDRYLDFAEALEELFQLEVDVLTPLSIESRFFRDSVDQCRETMYESALATDQQAVA